MRPTLLLVLVLIFIGHARAETAGELQTSIRTAVGEARFADALGMLKTLEQDYPDTFSSNDLDYLAARLSVETGDPAAAARWYLACVKRGSALKPYALLHLSEIARASGDLMVERIYLDEIAAFYPGSPIAEFARNRRARSWLASGNYSLAIEALGSLVSFGGTQPKSKLEDMVTREDRLLLARAQLLAGNTADARAAFTAVLESGTNPNQPDDHSLAAVKGLDKIDLGSDNRNWKASALTDGDHMQRAFIYQFNRDLEDARLHYAAILRDLPNSAAVPDAIYQTGRSYSQEGNYPEAINWFERVIEQFPEHAVKRDALLQAGNAYARVGKPHEAVRRYEQFIESYPSDDRLARAYLNIVDILRDQGEETDALNWSAKMQEVFRGKVGEALGAFAEVRINLSSADWDGALAGLDRLLAMPELGGATVPGGTSRTEVSFLRAYALEQKRRFPDAIDAYLAIPDGRNEYYGGRATERLQDLAKIESARSAIANKLASLHTASNRLETDRRNLQSAIRLTTDTAERERLLATLKKIYGELPLYRSVPAFDLVDLAKTPVEGSETDASLNRIIGRRLAALGLFDEAAPEIEAALGDKTATGDIGYSVAVLNSKGDRGHKAVAFAEPLWRQIPADYQIELIPTGQIELLYPAPFRYAFRKYALPRNVDPRFLLSIIRQESRYRPDVKSNAAARGLMQFISTTSTKIAASLGRTDFDQNELYAPSTAILFGSQYVADLFRLFPNQPHAVAGSYNGGEDNIRRWIARSRSDQPDRYVPEIAFSQSKDYVYKVMANYRVYRMFYGNDLSPVR